MRFSETPEFQKELKRFVRKYKSLPDDLQEFRRVISVVPYGSDKHSHVIAETKFSSIIKARLFCRYLKGSSLRIVYMYSEHEQHICFIELYFKGDKENEDYGRVKQYLANIQNRNGW